MSLLLCGWLDRIKGTFGHMTEKHSFTMLDHNSSLSNTKNRKRRFERCGEAGGTAKKPDASVVISVSASQDFTYRPNLNHDKTMQNHRNCSVTLISFNAKLLYF